MTGIPLCESKDPQAKAALARLDQIKRQLNLSPSPISRQAPIDMMEERAAAEFNIDALAIFWAGGSKRYKLVKEAYEFIKNDPELVVQPPRNFLELSRDELREFTMGQIFRVVQVIQEIEDKELAQEIAIATNIYSESFSMRFYVHEYLFRNVIQMLGNKEQQDRYHDDISNYRILGCFAMTELGHSSALRDIETTATYDISTDEFIINSPNLTSTKWWIGMAGQTATHTVVIAQTIIHGKNVGLNWFVVQLRSKYTGELEPGIQAGDIGHKVGRHGLDNGWIQFREKRIPRQDMLSRWTSVDRHGDYRPAPNPAIMYATLIPERLSLVTGTTQSITQALTIATRYSIVRRQGHKNQQIMDYQSHYVKLIPAIAFMYMVRSTADVLNEQFEILTAGGEMEPMVYLNYMGEMHAISASLKGFAGWYATDILETCRRSCGGHAYSAYNNIGNIISDWGVMTTGGGDNVVLLQQTTRYLLHRLEQSMDYDEYPDLQFKGSSIYIKHAKRYLENKVWTSNDASDCLKDFALIQETMNTILVKRLYSIQQALKNHHSTSNDILLESVRIAELHCAAFLFSVCAEKYGQAIGTAGIEPTVLAIMKKLTALWGIHTLFTYADQGFKEGYFQPDQINSIEKTYLELCKSLRKQVIGLTDGFGFPDFILKAPIAKYDGDIYQTYIDTLLTAPKSTGIPSYHAKYIKPLTERENSSILK
ncbi:acyl-CoA dehydrogenase/oxidase [Cokeromyces recurvatus]|uniref:acyl-CoA dehydrogenase/oxidase n=1 Tax=Cokeromyces recurvatus TaxID=90255 RepID=UPI002221281D|nr:acyl-CoA dehydrogenase/oxidase [Cokeromyces recurvatus]KAI7903339.1 acyl-CoA dehydrogenase/oxidase [Cokeromyces recurvatus]